LHCQLAKAKKGDKAVQIRDSESYEETWPRKTDGVRKGYQLTEPGAKPAPVRPQRISERETEEAIEELGEPVNDLGD
jgi:hypothetical protein